MLVVTHRHGRGGCSGSGPCQAVSPSLGVGGGGLSAAPHHATEKAGRRRLGRCERVVLHLHAHVGAVGAHDFDDARDLHREIDRREPSPAQMPLGGLERGGAEAGDQKRQPRHRQKLRQSSQRKHLLNKNNVSYKTKIQRLPVEIQEAFFLPEIKIYSMGMSSKMIFLLKKIYIVFFR